MGIAFSGETVFDEVSEDGAIHEPVRLRGTLAGDLRLPADKNDPAVFSPGAELWVNNTVAFRAGMREARDYTTGISLNVAGVRFDYAFLFSRSLENTHVFSTSFLFE